MNLEMANTIQRIVGDIAVELGMRNIPQLQVPIVDFIVPRYADIGVVHRILGKRLSANPNAAVSFVRKGAQFRLRVEYRT